MSDYTKEELTPEEIERRRKLREQAQSNWTKPEPSNPSPEQSFLKGGGWLDNIRKKISRQES